MKQEEATERIMRVLILNDLIDEDNYNTIAPFFDQSYAAGYERGSKIRVTGREIVQLTMEGNKIAVFESALIASRRVGSHPDNVRQAARGVLKTCKGYKWKYMDEFVQK